VAFWILVGIANVFERIYNSFLEASQFYIGVSPTQAWFLTLSMGFYLFASIGLAMIIETLINRMRRQPYDVTAPVVTPRGTPRKFLRQVDWSGK
jgi:hypothetical protein